MHYEQIPVSEYGQLVPQFNPQNFNGLTWLEGYRTSVEYQGQTLSGFSKTWGMTGWRLGYVAGPEEIIEKMLTLQQYSFTCPPSFAQKAAVKAFDCDMGAAIDHYREKRDFIYEALRERYRVQRPLGSFFIFPETDDGDGESPG